MQTATRLRRLAGALVTLGALLLVGGCSSSGRAREEPVPAPAPAPPTRAGFDACRFLTAEEVATATGQPVSRAVRKQDLQDFSQCFYEFGPESGGPAVVVEFDKSKAGLNALNAQKAGAEAVSGLGEESWWTAKAGALLVRARGGVLRVSMALAAPRLTAADLKPMAVKLATTAVGRLP